MTPWHLACLRSRVDNSSEIAKSETQSGFKLVSGARVYFQSAGFRCELQVTENGYECVGPN